MVQFPDSINSDGSGCVASIVESKAVSDANQEAVGKIRAQFAGDLETESEASGFDDPVQV